MGASSHFLPLLVFSLCVSLFPACPRGQCGKPEREGKGDKGRGVSGGASHWAGSTEQGEGQEGHQVRKKQTLRGCKNEEGPDRCLFCSSGGREREVQPPGRLGLGPLAAYGRGKEVRTSGEAGCVREQEATRGTWCFCTEIQDPGCGQSILCGWHQV